MDSIFFNVQRNGEEGAFFIELGNCLFNCRNVKLAKCFFILPDGGDTDTKLCVTVDRALIHSVLSGEWSDCE